jgi:PRTRC genetic system protein E
MFKELAPVLRHRAVLMTITSTEDDQIRVNVVPKKLKDDENMALTTPITVTGAAEELDAELGATLVDFVASHLQLKNTLVQAKVDMEAAAKVAKVEARAKSNISGKKESAADAQPGAKSGEAVKPAESPKSAVPKSPSLFDMGLTQIPTAPVTPATASQRASSEESEEKDILAEIDESNDSEDLEDAA